MNAYIPHFYCLVGREYLDDLRAHHGEFEPCAVFGVASIPNRALGFHILTEGDAQVARIGAERVVQRTDRLLAGDVGAGAREVADRAEVIGAP